jgi:adenylate cyclase class 2
MNGHETEVKFYVRDLKHIEMRLLELKAHLIQRRTHEINFRFDAPGGELRKQGKVLRLRKDDKVRLTFKGPSKETTGGVLTREEFEFEVGDFEGAKQFLEALGFAPIVFYEKFRATYELHGIHVMLDEMPYGEFVEIEGEKIETLQEAARLLGLKWDAMVKAGYHKLFERAAEKYGLDPTRLSFEALASIHVTADDLGVEPQE